MVIDGLRCDINLAVIIACCGSLIIWGMTSERAGCVLPLALFWQLSLIASFLLMV